ncbi:MAG: exodeoxyribonuclease III [Nitriliruptoraceae bacterium]
MRLVTWNVNSVRARLPRVLELLDVHRPDVVCLQETKVDAAGFPAQVLHDAGYSVVEHSEGRWNGVALLVAASTPTLQTVCRGLPGEPNPAEARWIDADVDGVRIASVYVPNGREPTHPMFDEKLRFLEAMEAHAAGLVAAGPTIIAGDFNVAREDRDVWDPSMFVGATHVTPDERGRLEELLAVGLTDAHRVAVPEGSDFTWWDYRMGAFRRGMGMRIDLALVSRHVTVDHVEVDTVFRRNNEAGDKPSDHAPVVVDVTVEG